MKRKRQHQSPAAAGRPWYEIKAATMSGDGASAEIYIFDEIGDSWWGESTSAADFVSELKALGDVTNIALHLNSPGGSVFDGVAIHNALSQHRAKVTTYVDGYAASIASIIALAGDEVVMAENAMMMIHNPWSYAIGDSQEMRKVADALDKIREAMLTTYMRHTDKTEEDILAALDAETWLTAADCVEWGFADTIAEAMPVAASTRFDFAALGLTPPPVATSEPDFWMGEVADEAEPQAQIAPRGSEQTDTIQQCIDLLQGLIDDEESEPEEEALDSGDMSGTVETGRLAALVRGSRF